MESIVDIMMRHLYRKSCIHELHYMTPSTLSSESNSGRNSSQKGMTSQDVPRALDLRDGPEKQDRGVMATWKTNIDFTILLVHRPSKSRKHHNLKVSSVGRSVK
jgi:hypothetical protein